MTEAYLTFDERRAIVTSGCKHGKCRLRNFTCSGEWLMKAKAGVTMPCGGESRIADNSRVVVVNAKPEQY